MTHPHNPQRIAVKPGQAAPPEPPVVVEPNWFQRAWAKIKAFFRRSREASANGLRAAGRATGNFFIRVGHGIVLVYDYVVTRIMMLMTSLNNGLFQIILWIIKLPGRVIAYFWTTNREEIAREIVHERQLNRAERRAALRAERARRRAEARMSQRSSLGQPRHATT